MSSFEASRFLSSRGSVAKTAAGKSTRNIIITVLLA